MDCNELDNMLETVEKSNRFNLFIKKVTLHFLLLVSLLSFFLSYASGFSFFYSYYFHSSTFVLPLLTHVLERKYMFLVCNGILAFLAKNMTSSSSSYTVFDPNGEQSDRKLKETSEAPLEESETATERNAGPSQHAELEIDVEEEQRAEAAEEKETMYSYAAEDKRESNVLISEDSEQEDEEGTEEGWDGPIGASPAEDGSNLNMNTEELNRKIEAFIRKMKEEIRIEAQQQLITV